MRCWCRCWSWPRRATGNGRCRWACRGARCSIPRSEEHTSELQSHRDLHSFPTRRSSDLGLVNALLVPLLVVAAARNREWSLQVGVSRGAVFYSTSLMVIAFYIIATAVGGYYVRLYGGDWGRVAEITLICFALLAALVFASSGQARS